MYNDKQRKIDKRCNIKDKQIAYFNSVNASIELLKDKALEKEVMEKELRYWRNWFLKEWKQWYLDEVYEPEEDPQIMPL